MEIWNSPFMRSEIPYLQATMYYFFYYINTFPTRRGLLEWRLKKGMHCHSFIHGNWSSKWHVSSWLAIANTSQDMVIFCVWRYGFSQRWKSLYSTPVYIINNNLRNYLSCCKRTDTLKEIFPGHPEKWKGGLQNSRIENNTARRTNLSLLTS